MDIERRVREVGVWGDDSERRGCIQVSVSTRRRVIMEEQSPSSAMSGDNFEAFMTDPLQSPLRPGSIASPLRDISSPAFKPAPLNNEANDGKAKSAMASPVSPSRISRAGGLMSNLVQPWGLFGQGEEDNGPVETVRHPLMGHHPLSDEEEEELTEPSNLGLGEHARNSLDGVSTGSPSRLPTASAASTTQTFSNSPEAVTSARPVLNASPLSFASRSFGGPSDVSSLRKLAVQPSIRFLCLCFLLQELNSRVSRSSHLFHQFHMSVALVRCVEGYGFLRLSTNESL